MKSCALGSSVDMLSYGPRTPFLQPVLGRKIGLTKTFIFVLSRLPTPNSEREWEPRETALQCELDER